MEKDRKYFFDANIFDAPPKEEIVEDLPPPPPVYSEEELATSKDMAFEQGRQQGQREERESRDQNVAQMLAKIADSFSHLFAAELIRENIFEKESVRLVISVLDILYPSMDEKIGRDEVMKVLQKTLTDHRKTKEITITVPVGYRTEIESMIGRIRASEHEEAIWRIVEDPAIKPGDCTLEWADGGAIRDTVRTARDIRKTQESLLDGPQPALDPNSVELRDSDPAQSDVSLKDVTESADKRGEDE